jgi:hypothetical protein
MSFLKEKPRRENGALKGQVQCKINLSPSGGKVKSH